MARANRARGSTEEYQQAKEVGGDRHRSHVKLLAEQRNAWISGFAFVLWVILHRYRSLLKQNYRLQDKLAERVDQERQAALAAMNTARPSAPPAPAGMELNPPKSAENKKSE